MLGNKMKYFYTSIMIFLTMNVPFASAYCPSYPNVEQEFWESNLVFVGKVISEEKVHETKDGFFDGINYRISVMEFFRGNANREVVVFSENSSGRFPMDIGKSYLVFTSITSGTFAGGPVYTVSYCGNSGEVTKGKKALALVRKLSVSSRNKHP